MVIPPEGSSAGSGSGLQFAGSPRGAWITGGAALLSFEICSNDDLDRETVDCGTPYRLQILGDHLGDLEEVDLRDVDRSCGAPAAALTEMPDPTGGER